MATPAELAFERTNLDEAQLGHLQRLLGTWGILADLSFSDLVLLAPMAARPADDGGPTRAGHDEATELVILGQMRPSNSATVVRARPGRARRWRRPTGRSPSRPSRLAR